MGYWTKFREELLGVTVRQATKSCDFYNALYSDIDGLPSLISDLSRLPVVTRRKLREAGRRARSRTGVPVLRQHTSGTTERSLCLYRTAEEIQFISEFFRSGDLSGNNAPIGLELSNQGHGQALAVPTAGFNFQGSVYDLSFMRDLVARTLLAKHEIPNTDGYVSAISGLVSHVVLLTEFLRASDFRFQDCHVRTIVVTGQRLSPRWFDYLRRTWNSTIVDRFSLTEVFGGANKIGEQKSFLFDPMVIPEVVSPDTLKPLDEGMGILLLTALFPFVQHQPIIRYATGDIAARQRADDLSDNPAFEILGRTAGSWLDAQQRIILPSGIIFDVVDADDEVARAPVFRDLETILPTVGRLGPPRAAVTVDANGTATLRIVPRFNTRRDPRRVAIVRKRIREQLEQHLPRDYRNKFAVDIVSSNAKIVGYRPTHV